MKDGATALNTTLVVAAFFATILTGYAMRAVARVTTAPTT